MFDDSMSPAEIRARHVKLRNKGSGRTRREDTEFYLLDAYLHNGGRVETVRDYTESKPKKKGFFS